MKEKTIPEPSDTLRQFVRVSLDYCVKSDDQRRLPVLGSDSMGFWTCPVEISLRPGEDWPQ